LREREEKATSAFDEELEKKKIIWGGLGVSKYSSIKTGTGVIQGEAAILGGGGERRRKRGGTFRSI